MSGTIDSVRILHVDDEPGFAEMTATFLERENDQFTVETATSVRDGRNRIDRADFDCILSDYDMPGQNGIEFLNTVRATEPDLPFILFTGKGSEEVASDAISAGVTDYIQKESGTDHYAVVANRIANAVERYRPGPDDEWMLDGVITDSTERKERERELERYEAYLQGSTDIITVLDDSGTIKYQSPSVARILGYDPDELIGQNGFDFIHPDDVDAVYTTFVDLVSQPGETVTVECRFRTADDEWRWLEIRGTNQLDRDAINGVVTNNRDITERKEREQRLNTLVEQFEALHEATRELLLADDHEEVATIITNSISDIFDYPSTAVRFREDDLLVPVVVTQIAREELGERPAYRIGDGLPGEVFESGEPRIVDDLSELDDGIDRGRHRSALYLPIGDHGTLSIGTTEPAVFDESDKSLVSILTNNAATVLGRLDREYDLKRQNDRLDGLINAISHDLRNPLDVAEGNLELARVESDSERLDPVERSLERMRTLIDDLLTLAREGAPVDEMEAVRLAGVTEACWRNVETTDATLVIDTDRTIRADQSRFQQLLENLMRNAVEHGGADVAVRIGELSDREGFYIADDGPGIPPDDRETVFESGYSTSKSGTGFGLAIVKEIADAHGWGISVTDSADGGARFEVTGVTFVDG